MPRDAAAKTRFDPALARPTSAAATKLGRGPETRVGDAEAALLSAPIRMEANYRQGRQQHHPMEPHATIAEWQGNNLRLWSKTQWVGNERDEIARRFGIAPDNVHVINPFVGGAFGSALRTWPHVTLAVMAARRIEKPVRLELTRRQMVTYVGARGMTEQHVALGADRDGELLALVHEVTGQTSIYEEFVEPALSPAKTTYACPNILTRYRLVDMNINTPCPMRGPGWASGLIGLEIALDELAATLALDPVELRLQNHADRDPTKNLPWTSKQLRQCYLQGAERFGWRERSPRPREMRAGRDLVGFGMADGSCTRRSRYPTSARATIFADGHAEVRLRNDRYGPRHLHIGDASCRRCAQSANRNGSFRTRRLDISERQRAWRLDDDVKCGPGDASLPAPRSPRS